MLISPLENPAPTITTADLTEFIHRQLVAKAVPQQDAHDVYTVFLAPGVKIQNEDHAVGYHGPTWYGFHEIMIHFDSWGGKTESDVPADPSLPDYKRDVQFTVNGQFQPVIRSKAGQTEIWVLANVSDVAYINIELTETASGRHPPIAIVGQDGNPYPAVHYPPTDNGTRLLVPPASRFAIAG